MIRAVLAITLSLQIACCPIICRLARCECCSGDFSGVARSPSPPSCCPGCGDIQTNDAFDACQAKPPNGNIEIVGLRLGTSCCDDLPATPSKPSSEGQRNCLCHGALKSDGYDWLVWLGDAGGYKTAVVCDVISSAMTWTAAACDCISIRHGLAYAGAKQVRCWLQSWTC